MSIPPMGTITDVRDGNTYATVVIEELLWLKENLRYNTPKSIPVQDTVNETPLNCGRFYLAEEVQTACPEGWRLPTVKEVQRVLKLNKRGKIELSTALNIAECGRISMGNLSEFNTETTFWTAETVVNGYATHWHWINGKHYLHSHDVELVQRQFPVRCVCEIETESLE